VIERLDHITPEELQQVAQKYFQTAGMALGALGNLNGFQVDRARLEI
jgi:predicted Zn-dependent peptidase